jgi:hypothetical protein
MGQNQIRFVDSNAVWNVATTFPAGNAQNPNFVSTQTKVYGFKGDTLIGGEVWNRMFRTTDSAFNSNLTFQGNLREENGFVYLMDSAGIVDTLYNFNLLVGDSVAYDFGSGNQYLTVATIDSALIDGNYHKRFSFSEPTGPSAFTIVKEIWIEGIGSIHGPLFSANPTLFSTEIPDSMFLTCYKISGVTHWNNPFCNDCYINIVLSLNDFQSENGTVLVFPNPVKNELEIDLRQIKNEELVISVYDLTGKLVMTKYYGANSSLIIDASSLPDGFYVLKMESESQTCRTNFIKQ